MRLPESQIKEALLHSEKLARQAALDYFAKSYSRDQEVMPLAIQAIETYGRKAAFQYIYPLSALLQTEASVDWAVRELNQEAQIADDDYFDHLSRLLLDADPSLTAPRETDIVNAPRFSEELVPELQEHISFLSWDADRCWKELENVAEEGKDSNEIDYRRVERIISLLARQGEQYAERILALLGEKIENFEHNPMVWMEIFLVQLAGEMRLETALPLVMSKFREGIPEDADFLTEVCFETLVKIGTDAVVQAVSEGFAEAEWDYQLDASDMLAKIRSDAAVAKCLELLPQAKQADIKTQLASGPLTSFASEGVEPARQLILNQEDDPGYINLREDLVAACLVMGTRFPEFDSWKAEIKEQEAKYERRRRELLEWKYSPPTPSQYKPANEYEYEYEPPQKPFVHLEAKVGRNDPCPCGSGKKFKKCCLTKTTHV